MDKWNRRYTLTIQNEGEEAVIISYPLTIDIAITRGTWSMSGRATFRIYNLNKETRGRIYRNFTEIPRLMTIKLEAGYGNNLSTIFDGNVIWARSSRGEGETNNITEINAQDYGFVTVNSTSEWTVQGKDASKDAVIRRLCTDLKRPVDGVMTPLPIGAIGVFDKTERRPVSVAGNTWEYLKTETGGNCFIDSGKVFCIAPNEVIEGEITEISNNTGLLGSPRVDGIHLFAEMVFEPGLKIGQWVDLTSTALNSISRNFSGVYKIIALEHSGTISGAVSGRMKTRVTLMVGSQGEDNPLKILIGGE